MSQTAQAVNPQLNVRMSSQVRRRGDMALANMGFTPTQAVRALWGLACGGAGELELLKSALDCGQASGEACVDPRATSAFEADEALERGRGLFAASLERKGVSPVPVAHAQSDEGELYASAIMERLEGRGLA